MPTGRNESEGERGAAAPRPLIGVSGRRFLASALNTDPGREMIFAGLRLDGFYSAYAEKLASAGAMPHPIRRNGKFQGKM